MKKFSSAFVFAALVCLLTLSGCNKYEDGPAFSLLSKTQRLAREWTFDKLENFGGTQLFIVLTPDKMKLKKDQSCVYTGGSETLEGKWSWRDDKESLSLSVQINNLTILTEEFTILRLTAKELKLKNTLGTVFWYKAN